jgi:hypothetical protein
MAFPVVEGVAENSVNTAGTSHAVTLPASIAASDLVLIIMDIGSTSATLNALTDWTEDLDEAVANGLKILRYTGAGVPSNPTFTSSANTRSASLAYRISGADKSVAPQIGTTATGTSTAPDPPSVTPTGGIAKDYLSIAFYGAAGEEADDDTWSDTSPTNWTPSPPRQKSCGTAGSNLGGLIAAAERQSNTGSAIDPGVFAKDVSAAWRAQQILIHPDTTQNLSGTLYSNAPTFFTGTVTPGDVTLAGTLFTSAPTFFTGDVSQTGGGSDGYYDFNTATTRALLADEAGLDATGDVEWRFDVAPDDWTPAAAVWIADRWQTSGNNRVFRVQILTNGNISVSAGQSDGTSRFTNTLSWDVSGAPSDGERWQLRITLDADNGSGDTILTLYSRPGVDGLDLEDDTGWTQENQDTITGTHAFMASSASPVALHSTSESGSPGANGFIGKFYRGLMWGDLTKTTKVFDADFTVDNSVGGDEDIWNDLARTGNWTIQGTADSDWIPPTGELTLTGTLFQKAPTFFTGSVVSTVELAGTLFVRAPTFFTGSVTPVYNLTGTLFTKAPTFFTGAVTPGAVTLTGSLFQKAPTFFAGTVTPGSVTLTGTLFQRAPTFFGGTVTPGAVTLTGTLFQNAPVFFAGSVGIEGGPQNLTGTLFQKAPTFFTGTLDLQGGPQNLTGILFQKAPTFPQGAVTSTYPLDGTLFQKAPTFFTGAVTAGDAVLTGVLFQKAPTFFVGSFIVEGLTFWTPNPAGYTTAPVGYTPAGVAYDPVGSGDPPL